MKEGGVRLFQRWIMSPSSSSSSQHQQQQEDIYDYEALGTSTSSKPPRATRGALPPPPHHYVATSFWTHLKALLFLTVVLWFCVTPFYTQFLGWRTGPSWMMRWSMFSGSGYKTCHVELDWYKTDGQIEPVPFDFTQKEHPDQLFSAWKLVQKKCRELRLEFITNHGHDPTAEELDVRGVIRCGQVLPYGWAPLTENGEDNVCSTEFTRKIQGKSLNTKSGVYPDIGKRDDVTPLMYIMFYVLLGLVGYMISRFSLWKTFARPPLPCFSTSFYSSDSSSSSSASAIDWLLYPFLLVRWAWSCFTYWIDHYEGSTRGVALLRIGLVLNLWSRFALDLLSARTGQSLLRLGWKAAFGFSFYPATAMLLVGLFTPFASTWTAITMLLIRYGVGAAHEPYTHHHTTFLTNLVALLPLLPCGSSYSLDNWLRVKGFLPPVDRSGVTERGKLWAVPLVVLQVMTTYFWGAWSKCNAGYLNGDRLEAIFMYHHWDANWPSSIPFFHETAVIGAFFSVGLELALAFWPLLSWQMKKVSWILGVVFHGALYATLPVFTFSSTVWTAYIVMWPPQTVHDFIEQSNGVVPHVSASKSKDKEKLEE